MAKPKRNEEIMAQRGLETIRNQGWHTEDLQFDDHGKLIIKNAELASQLREIFDDANKKLTIVLEGGRPRPSKREMTSGPKDNSGRNVETVQPTNMMCPCGPEE